MKKFLSMLLCMISSFAWTMDRENRFPVDNGRDELRKAAMIRFASQASDQLFSPGMVAEESDSNDRKPLLSYNATTFAFNADGTKQFNFTVAEFEDSDE